MRLRTVAGRAAVVRQMLAESPVPVVLMAADGDRALALTPTAQKERRCGSAPRD
jgi:hypothetical protein